VTIDASTTSKTSLTPVVVVVGQTPAFIAWCRDVAAGLGAIVRPSDVAGAATAAAHWRPVALVLSEDVHAFDPVEWDALARDVGAMLLVTLDGLEREELEALLARAIERRPAS
jgi:hypothetical protein